MDYIALVLFVISASVTPGPNNIMVMTSGINHGLRKSIPHLVGINTGFPLMIVLVGLGFNTIFEKFPFLFNALKIVSAVYLLFIAYGIFKGSIGSDENSHRKPMTMIEAALFQWINPKAWIMVIGVLAAFTNMESSYLTQTLFIALIFMLFGPLCTGLWLYSGVGLKKLLSKKIYLQIFNTSMALLLVVSLWPIFKDIYEFLVSRA